MPQTVYITEHALIQRMRRYYRSQGNVFHLCPENSRWFHQLGRYYVTDSRRNVVTNCFTLGSLEDLARENSVMTSGEEVK